jgi:hypothetical protein
MANRLASLAVLVILTFVPNNLQAQNSAANTAAPGSALPPKLMSKMLQLITLKGVDRDVAVPIANALGLSASGQTWPDRQVVVRTPPSTDKHGFMVNRGSDQDVVLYIRLPDNAHAFRAHRNGRVVTALILDLKTNQITMRTPNEAQSELDSEIAYWTKNVDSAISGK